MRKQAVLAALSAAALALIAASACSSFDGDGSEPALDAAPDVATADVDAALVDAAARDAVDGADASAYDELARGTNVSAIAVVGAALYYADRTADGGAIHHVRLDDRVASVVHTGDYAATQLAVTAETVFWIDPVKSALFKVRTDGTAEATKTFGNDTPTLLTAAGDRAMVAFFGRIARVDSSLNDRPSVTGGEAVGDLAVGGNQLLWSEPNSKRIRKVMQPDESGFEQAIGGETGIRSIAADDATLYWSRDSTVLSSPINGAPSARVIATGQASPFALTAYDGSVYWLTTDGALRTARHDDDPGVPARTIATGQPVAFARADVQAIGVTLASVIWLTSDGRVLRAPR